MLDRARVVVRAVAHPTRLPSILILLLLVSASACLSDDSDDSDDASPTISTGSPTSHAVQPTGIGTDATTPTVSQDSPTTAASDPTTAVVEGSTTPTTGEGSPVVVLRGPGVTVGEVTEDGDAFAGQRVVVHGEVLEVIAEGVFTIVDDAETLLVTGADAVAMTNLTPGTFVRVAGNVQAFDLAALEAELGTTIDDTVIARFEGQPAITAESVQVGPLDVSVVLAELDSIQDQVVGVIGEVDEVVGPQGFVLRDPGTSDGGEPVLVVTPYLAVPGESAVGALVQARGVVQTLDTSDPSALGDEYGFLSDPAYDAFDGQPVIVAEQVEVVAPGATSSVEDVTGGNDDLVGQSAVLREVVTEVIGDRAFVVGDEERLLVVVAAGEVPPTLGEGALVVIDGIVTRLDLAAPPVVDPTGGVDWNTPAIEAFEGELILLTRSVTVIDFE